MRIFSTIIAILFFTLPAYSHDGHVGELAGHAHWIGLAAGVAVTAIAVGLIKGKKSENEGGEAEEISSEDVPDEELGETA